MNLLIVIAALVFLMFVAYRGYSVILFAPIAALGAVLLTDPSLVPPMFSSVFMEKMVGFVKNYFPVFMLGAVFGKVIELSGFSKSIVSAVIIVSIRPVLLRHAVAQPNARSSHRVPTPQGAGIAVMVATLVVAGVTILQMGAARAGAR